MSRTMITLLVALFVAPVLAGCLGGDDVETPDDDGLCESDCKIDGTLKEGKGRIFGKIMDTEFEVVAGANVTLRERALTTQADEFGRYAFNNLDPGPYTVYAKKEGTHIAQAETTEVTEGGEHEVDIQLERLPPPPKPYSLRHDGAGLIGCAFSYGYIAATDWCSQLGDENTNTQFEVAIDPRLTGMVFRLESSDSQISAAFTAELSVAFFSPGGAFAPIRGAAPLEAQYEFEEEDPFKSWNDPPSLQFEVRANHEASTPQLAFQQPINWWIGTFYNWEPIPDGYSPKGG